MKRFIAAAVLAAVLLCGCSGFAEPDVSELISSVADGQNIVEASEATEEDISVIFNFDAEKVEECKVIYSGDGGYADMIAVFKLASENSCEEFENMLSDYKSDRYEDFKGYAPMEAEKIENGRVLTYGKYVILLIVQDISGAIKTVDAAFSA